MVKTGSITLDRLLLFEFLSKKNPGSTTFDRLLLFEFLSKPPLEYRSPDTSAGDKSQPCQHD